jgi:acetyl-CoA carboxylase biotin carboxylase subunit
LLEPKAHAIECRIYAEDPDNNFMPSPGRIQGLRVPQGPGVRDDSGAYEGGEVPIFYDPMISKLITWGDTRDHAIARMRRALREYEVRGIKTTIPFFQWVLDDADFLAARFDTGFIDRKLGERKGEPLRAAGAEDEEIAAIVAALTQVIAPAAEEGGAAAAITSRWRDAGRTEALR